jgi:hypothetical protein
MLPALYPIARIAAQVAMTCLVVYVTEYAQTRAREAHKEAKRRAELADQKLINQDPPPSDNTLH